MKTWSACNDFNQSIKVYNYKFQYGIFKSKNTVNFKNKISLERRKPIIFGSFENSKLNELQNVKK